MTEPEITNPPVAEAPAQAELVLLRGGTEAGPRYALGAKNTIGRFDPSVGPIDVDLGDLPEGSYVSRKHALIAFEDGAWVIRDLGSSNGVFVLREDFEKVEEATLENGMEVALGNAQFVFRLQTPQEPEPEPEPELEA